MKNLAMYLSQKIGICTNFSLVGFVNFDTKFKVRNIIFPNFKTVFPIEDPRIFTYMGNIFCSVTKVTKNKIYPCLYRLDNKFNVDKIINYKGYISRNKTQKNWCPFVVNKELYIHTDCYPIWTVYKLDSVTGIMRPFISKKVFKEPGKNSYIRCSTSWKIYNISKLICVIHIKYYDPLFKKLAIIKSLLVEICSLTFLPYRHSKIFCCDKEHHPINFISGLEISNGNIILSSGIGDYKFSIDIIEDYENFSWNKSLLI